MTKRLIVTVCLLAVLLPSCAYLPAFTQDEYYRRRHEEMEQQYSPYRQRNTIDGYRDFVAKYPENMYVSTALDQIDNLEFAPYEKTDTIASYTEFVARYPKNRHVVKARGRIDQANVKGCESIDTVQGYREFLTKHPDNIFVQTAQERLQDLEFRELALKLQQQYGFDLLLYRLKVKRLQKELPQESGINLGDFTLFASTEPVQGKKYFKSHLIYSTDLSSLARAPAAVQEKIFDSLISKLLITLLNQFRAANDIDGFSFAIASSPHRFYGDEKTALEYVFPAREARLFAQNRCDRSQLLAQAAVRQTAQPAPVAEKSQPGSGGPAPVKLEGGDIMEKSAGRQRAQDFIMSSTWKRACKDGTVHEMQMIRKWKDFKGAGGFSAKSVMRYIINQNQRYAVASLALTDTSGSRQYWCILSRGDAGRPTDIDTFRPPAERDFPLPEFTGTPVGQERHQYAGTALCGSAQCFMVHSTPESAAAAQYSKKISFIDQQSLLPVKIEYFDKSGALWKTAHIDWQETGGVWCWKRAVVENAQSGDVTTIVITDVQVNAGLPDSDFTPGALLRR